MLVLAGCAGDSNLLGLGPQDHCFATFSRLVKTGDAVEVWEKTTTPTNAGGQDVRVVRMNVSVNGRRDVVQCTYPASGPANALAVQVGRQRLTAAQVAALNKDVRENRDAGAEVRKSIPSPPNIGRLTFDLPGTGKRSE